MGGFTECAGSCFSTISISRSSSFNRIFSELISLFIVFLVVVKDFEFSADDNKQRNHKSTSRQVHQSFYMVPLSNRSKIEQ
jgi:hypothetical protein